MKLSLARKGDSIGSDIDHFRRRLTNVFDDFFNTETGNLWESEWAPAVDVEEDVKAIYVKAEMPGVSEKDLSVTVHDSVLTIKGEKKEEKENKSSEKRSIVCERCYGSFSRSISLPAGIDPGKIEARYRDGLLTVTVPRVKPEEPKKISIDIK